MLSWLSSIGDTFGILIQFLSNIITGLLSVILLIPQALHVATVCIAYLPPVISAFAVCCVSLSIVLFIIGR